MRSAQCGGGVGNKVGYTIQHLAAIDLTCHELDGDDMPL
jgi:hypothetical protein